jgi:hypothetical protein
MLLRRRLSRNGWTPCGNVPITASLIILAPAGNAAPLRAPFLGSHEPGP